MQLTFNDFQLHDEIYFPKNSEVLANAPTKGLWENEAKRWERVGYGEILDGHGYPWDELPLGKHFDSILDIGCGYGRHPFYMSKYREITCNQYYGFDIAENMLRRLLRLRQEHKFLPSAEFSLFCIPVEQLPLPDNSIDFVISSSVFIHLTKNNVSTLLAEIARVIQPGGVFFVDDSFYNKYCPANMLQNFLRLVSLSKINQSYLQQYSLQEIHALLQNSQLTVKCPNYTIIPLRYTLIPEKLRGVTIPLAKEINDTIKPTKFLDGILPSSYSVHSDNLLQL